MKLENDVRLGKKTPAVSTTLLTPSLTRQTKWCHFWNKISTTENAWLMLLPCIFLQLNWTRRLLLSGALVIIIIFLIIGDSVHIVWNFKKYNRSLNLDFFIKF